MTAPKSDLEVTAFPNPYENNNFNLTINAPVSGEAMIQLFTMDGNRLSEMKTLVKKSVDQVVTVKVPTLYKTRLVYLVTIGSYQKRGIVLSPN